MGRTPAIRLASPAPVEATRIVASKLAPRPAVVELVPRTRLLDTVRRAEGARLVVVRAPAGFGKTSFMAAQFRALQEAGVATAWLTLDAGDNEVGRFIVHMLAAFQAVDPSLALITWSPDAREAGMPVAAMDLVQHVAAQTEPFALFVDNLEAVHDSTVLSMLRMLLDALPVHGQMLLGSREMPDFGIARLRAHGQLLEIGSATLRFSAQEAFELLRGRCGLALSEEQVGRLHQRTEGWAAALWLAALALHERHDVDAFVASFTGSSTDVADYLLDDVLTHLPEPTRRFLIQISVLDELRPAPCDALTASTDSRALLCSLERRGLFVVPQSVGRDSWRFHPLFREFLQAQLSAAEESALHAEASRWYVTQQQPVPAIEHAIRGGLHGLAIDLLAQHAEPLLCDGRVRLLARLFDGLPPAARRGLAPRLASTFAWALICIHRYGEALTLIERLEAQAGERDELAVMTQAQRAWTLAMTSRLGSALAAWERTLGRIPADTEPFAHGLQHNSYAFCLLAAGRFDEALAVAAAGMPSHHRIASSFNLAVAVCLEAEMHLTKGRARQAVERARVALSMATPHPGQHVSGSTAAAAYLANALYAADRLPEAKQLLDTYLPLISDICAHDQIITSHRCLARIALAFGDPGRAATLLDALEAIGTRQSIPRMARSAWIERSRIAMLDDDMQAATAALRRAQELDDHENEGLTPAAEEADSLAIAVLRLQVRSRPADALPLLRDAIGDAEGGGRLRRVHQLRILQVLALHGCGERAQAMRCLRSVLAFAESGGLMRSFAEEGPVVLQLLEQLRQPAQPAARVDIPRAAGTGLPSVEALTGTETRIVRLVAEGLANKLIARRLCVSEATVKTHLRSVSAKLGATNRTHAVALARQLGLLQAP